MTQFRSNAAPCDDHVPVEDDRCSWCYAPYNPPDESVPGFNLCSACRRYATPGEFPPMQTTIDGREVSDPIPAPAEVHEQDRMFDTGQQIPGQINLDTD